MRLLDTEAFCEQKIERIEAMLEQLALDTLLSVLYKISEKREQLPRVVCYNGCSRLRLAANVRQPSVNF